MSPPGIMSAGVPGMPVGGALPDERALVSVRVVSSISQCPASYVAVNRTYDEDSDAALHKVSGIFAKKSSDYICLSKTDGLPGYVIDSLIVLGERESLPAGYTVASQETQGAGRRRRRLCYRLARLATAPRPVTDVIVCSSMKVAPPGFVYAGEINGKVVCYKLSSGSVMSSPAHGDTNYENVTANGNTPDAGKRLRAPPERPPKMTTPDLSSLNITQTPPAKLPSQNIYPSPNDDYEALNPSYQISKPNRPAPKPPVNHPCAQNSPALNNNSPLMQPNSSFAKDNSFSQEKSGVTQENPSSVPPIRSPVSPNGVIGRSKKGPAPLPRGAPYKTTYNAYTLGVYNGLEGVPFVLDPKLTGTVFDNFQFPIIKKRPVVELDREFSYSFALERQL